MIEIQIKKGDIFEISDISLIHKWRFVSRIRNEFIDHDYNNDWFLFERIDPSEGSYLFCAAKPTIRYYKNNLRLDWKVEHYGMSIDDLSTHWQRNRENKWILIND